MKPKIRGWTRGWSQMMRARRPNLALASMWVMAIVMTRFASLSVTVMSVLLAYVGGESQWSKGEKDAVRALERFAHSGDERDYRAFVQRRRAARGRQARLEMDKARPDHARLVDAFRRGEIAREDVDGLIWLYRDFGKVPLVPRAVDYWKAGDVYVLRLVEIGERLHARLTTGSADARALAAVITEIEAVDSQVVCARGTPRSEAAQERRAVRTRLRRHQCRFCGTGTSKTNHFIALAGFVNCSASNSKNALQAAMNSSI
jgi:hypothetical protein